MSTGAVCACKLANMRSRGDVQRLLERKGGPLKDDWSIKERGPQGGHSEDAEAMKGSRICLQWEAGHYSCPMA